MSFLPHEFLGKKYVHPRLFKKYDYHYRVLDFFCMQKTLWTGKEKMSPLPCFFINKGCLSLTKFLLNLLLNPNSKLRENIFYSLLIPPSPNWTQMKPQFLNMVDMIWLEDKIWAMEDEIVRKCVIFLEYKSFKMVHEFRTIMGFSTRKEQLLCMGFGSLGFLWDGFSLRKGEIGGACEEEE